MNPALFDKPLFEVTLPILVGFFIATLVQNRGFDSVNKRLDDIAQRLGRIEILLADHDQRIARLEERTSPIARR